MAITVEGSKLTELHKILQVRLSSQAMAATKLLWSTMDPTQGKAAMDAWLKKQVALSGVFDKKSAVLAADYVKKFRATEGFPGGPIEGVQDFDPNWAENSLSYNGSNKVQMLMGAGVPAKEAVSQVTPYIMNAAQRLMMNGGRRVVDKSALANPASTGWRRVTDSNPCSFCAMLVSRGPAYRSPGTAGAGRHYHKRCGCTVEEVFGDWTPTEAEQRFVDAYDAAAAHLDSLGKPHAQTQILEHMRMHGKFSDSPKPKPPPVVKANPVHVESLKEQLKKGSIEVKTLETAANSSGVPPQIRANYKEALKQHHAEQVAELTPDPEKIAYWVDSVKSGEYTRTQLKETHVEFSKLGDSASIHKEKALRELDAAIDSLKPQPYPSLGANFRIDHAGQIYKGYPWKVGSKSGTAWKKVDAKGNRLHPDPPKAANPAKVAKFKEQVTSGKVTRAKLEEDYKTASPQAKLDLRAAINDLKPQPYPALGANFRISSDGQIWKGYPWKIKGKTGVAWKKVDQNGVRIHKDPPPKSKSGLKPEPKVVASLKASLEEGKLDPEALKLAADSVGSDSPFAVNVYEALKQHKALEPDVVLKNDYQKTKAAEYGWGQPELKAWVKSGLPMHEYQYQVLAAKPTGLKSTDLPISAPKKATAPAEPDVVLKNEYQKTTAASYGWGQPELKAWVKSGLPMHEYHASLQPKSKASAAPPKVTAAPGQGGVSWANQNWPSASAYTSTERSAFTSYTGSGYANTNAKLRASGGRVGASSGLDSAFKRSTSVVPNDTVVYRGVNSAKALGLPTDSGDLSKLVGHEYVEHGYMSTAVEGSGFSGQIKMTVKVPKGHRAVYVSHSTGSALSTYGSAEKELLLDRGTRFKITNVARVSGRYGDTWHVEVEVIPPPVRP